MPSAIRPLSSFSTHRACSQRKILRDYLAQFMEHVEVDDEEYARQRFVDVFQIGWEIEREFWEEDD